MKSILVAIRALAIALLGIALAALWMSTVPHWVTVGLIAAAVIAGQLLYTLGRRRLPAAPIAALRLMELWMLTPLAIAASATAAAIILSINFHVSSDASPERETMTKWLLASLVNFLTTGFIAWASNGENSPTASRIKDAFEGAYGHLTDSDSPIIYSNMQGIVGWSYAARRERVRKLLEVQQSARQPAGAGIAGP